MDEFLETYNLPRLNQEEIEDINRSITQNGIKSVIFKKSPKKQKPGPDVFTSKLYQTVKEELEKAMAPHSSTLAWKIPWAEEPGRVQSVGSRRVGHD